MQDFSVMEMNFMGIYRGGEEKSGNNSQVKRDVL